MSFGESKQISVSSPAFNPNEPYEEVKGGAVFNPDEPFEVVKKKEVPDILSPSLRAAKPLSQVAGTSTSPTESNSEAPLPSSVEITSTQKNRIPDKYNKQVLGLIPNSQEVKIADGSSITLDKGKVPLLNNPDYLAGLQERLINNVPTQEDIFALSKASGKSSTTVEAYVKGGRQVGFATETVENGDKVRQQLTDVVTKFNDKYQTDYDPQQILSNSEKAAQFFKATKEVPEAMANAAKLKGFDYESQSALLFSPVMQNDLTELENKVVQLTVAEDKNNGVPQNETIAKIARRLTPREFNQAIDASIPKYPETPIEQAGVAYDAIFGNADKQELLNTVKGQAALRYNDALEQNAIDKISKGVLENNPILVQEGKSDLDGVDRDMIYQYPSLIKQEIVRRVSESIAREAGQLQGSQTDNLKEKIFGAGVGDYARVMKEMGYFDNPKTADIALSLLQQSDLFADASYIGGVADNFARPFKELGLSVADVTGFRNEMDVLSDKKKAELFPQELSNTKTLIGDITTRSILNTTANLAGMATIAAATEGLGTGGGLPAGVSRSLGAYTSFGLPSYDGALKDSYNFLDNDGARTLYASISAIANAEGGRVLDLGKVIRIPGVSENFAKIAEGVSAKSIAQKGVTELLGKSKNAYIDFAIKYGKNVTKGAATMAYFNIANNVERLAFGDPTINAEDIVPEAAHAFVDGVTGMSILGAFGAKADMAREKNTTYKGVLYNMALNHDASKDVFQLGLQKGKYTQEEYNQKIKILNTSVAAKNALDAAQTESGVTLSENQKAVYVANKTAIGVLSEKAEETTNPQQKSLYESQIERLDKQTKDVMEGLKFSPTLEPLYDLFEAEKEYNAALEEVDNSPESYDKVEVAKTKYDGLVNKYLGNKKEAAATGTEGVEGLDKVGEGQNTATQPPTTQPLSNEEIQVVNENIDKIKVPIYKDIIKSGDESQINDVLKEVSDQWHDEKSRAETEANFGPGIVDLAVKKFPLEPDTGLQIKEEPNPLSQPIEGLDEQGIPIGDIFPDSKIKDIVYHGSNKSFDEFKKGGDIYFSSDKEIAKGYQEKYDTEVNPSLKEVRLNIKNPLVVDANRSEWHTIYADGSKSPRSIGNIVKDAKEAGYDGVIIKNVRDGLKKTDKVSDIQVVFDASQVHVIKEKEQPIGDNVPESTTINTSRDKTEFANPEEYYRVIVGDKAFADIVKTGKIRTGGKQFESNPIEGTNITLTGRPTRFPSFSKGEANIGYAYENPNNYIIVSKDPNIKPSTLGRHGKGKTMFPTDGEGKYLDEYDAKNVQVYKHIGEGRYELVYENGKEIKSKNEPLTSEQQTKTTEVQQPAEVKSLTDTEVNKTSKEAKDPIQTVIDNADNAVIPPKAGITVDEAKKEGVSIVHESTAEMRRENDFDAYERDPKTFEKWDSDADSRIANGDMPALLRKMEAGKEIGPVEQRMMGKYIATLDAEVGKNPTKENIATLKKAIELSDRVGGTQSAQSLVARKGAFLPEDSLGSFLLDKEQAQGFPLGENQIKSEIEKYNELKQAKDALESALKEEQEKNAILIAEKGLAKARLQRSRENKKTAEEYKKERKETLEAAKEALRKLKGDSGQEVKQFSVVPYSRELQALAPHIKKYFESLVNEGVDKLDNIVNAIHAEFKDAADWLTKSQVTEIIGGAHDEKQPTRSQKNNEIRLLKREAELLTQLKRERLGLGKEKSETRQAQTNARIEELKKKIKEVRDLNRRKEVEDDPEDNSDFNGDAEKTNRKREEELQKRLKDRINQLQNDIVNKKYAKEEELPFRIKLTRKTQELQDKVIELENRYQKERAEDQRNKLSKWERNWDKVQQTLGIRRIVQTAVDASIWLRQLGSVVLNPRRWGIAKNFIIAGSKSAFSQTKFDRIMNEIHKSPDFKQSLEDGVRYNDLNAVDPAKQNEFYAPRSFVYKIPVIREILQSSQRIADASLNTARYELYEKHKRALEKQGITRESDPQIYEEMAKLVMNSSGSGNLLKFLENPKAERVLGATFYGARLMAANFNMLNPVYYVKMPKAVRVEAMKDLAAYTSTVLATTLAMVAAGGTVSLNPDDPDFLQIRFGDKVYDLTGGKAAYIRTFLRLVEAGYHRAMYYAGKGTKSEADKSLTFAGESTLRFFRNKLAPNTGYILNALTGKNSIGQDFDPAEILKIYPMYVDDAYDAAKKDGFLSFLTVLLPNIMGIGYGSYYSEANQKPLEETLRRNLNSDEMNKELIKNYNDGGRTINNNEFQEFVNKRDDFIEKQINELYEGTAPENLVLDEQGEVITKKYSDMSKEEIIAATRSIKTRATRAVKEELFGKHKKMPREKIADRKLNNARKIANNEDD